MLDGGMLVCLVGCPLFARKWTSALRGGAGLHIAGLLGGGAGRQNAGLLGRLSTCYQLVD